MWWSDLLKALDERLGKSRQAAAVRRVVSTIRNNYGERGWQNTVKVAWKRNFEIPIRCSMHIILNCCDMPAPFLPAVLRRIHAATMRWQNHNAVLELRINLLVTIALHVVCAR